MHCRDAMREFNPNELRFCGCGCGEQMQRYYKGYECYERKFIHGHNWKGKFHYKWKGGIRISKGYIYVKKPDHYFADYDGYVRKHRLVYERYRKCCLLPWVHLHHINGDKKDNRINNLQPVSNSQHGKLHVFDMSNRFCSNCGSDKTRIRKNGRPHWIRDGDNKWLCERCYDTRRYDRIRVGKHYWETTKARLNR